MLDQADLQPIRIQGGGFGGGGGGGGGGGMPVNNNPASSYSGSHALYQDITIPANITKLTVSFNLYIDNTNAGAAGFSEPQGGTQTLDFNSANNQQVRVDLMNPSADPFAVGTDAGSSSPGVYLNLFLTAAGDPATRSIAMTIDLSQAANRGLAF